MMSQKQPKIEITEKINPELEERRNMTLLQFLQRMLETIENNRTIILSQIKQAHDTLKILEFDRKLTLEAYKNERMRIGREKR